MTDVSVIILTHNEEKHIARCLQSLQLFTRDIFIVDSFSTDRTVDIARSMGAVVVQNPWVNYATQFNFGITHTPFQSTWLMRMDADEYVLPELAAEISKRIATLPADVTGIYVKRRVLFFDRWIKHGDYYPIWLMRLWRRGQGICEETWMDEHIKLTPSTSSTAAKTIQFQNDLVDHNLNNLTWWTQKHNNYAIREVIDLLNIKYNFDETQRVEPKLFGSQEQRTRYLKIQYASLPLFTRPFLYFLYRYFFRMGFLDGRRGLIWHFLQAGWYRFLVDAKVFEVYFHAGRDKQAIINYFRTEYGKDLKPAPPRQIGQS
ncbi:glycosyltransferase family 2 protein [Spirosoma utsteinense]|uniref:Glycosyltransferase involved in cell wall biosynthesis n=1 Tax=Spirosoma utsteinense TaxID=2585773 RepID=A0ABR6W858_9BACT|nr:glycosyltransferase family 2 protein [Spirosoma utsteinense]MBC3786339.1 glycosyltransferase involved in cell wall biosynthesis [Spirosoma utsteinense]MBC3791965.1 glycosyltransferase involved in cell wall biosynthesis [Spirosoma utsteinense]